MELMNYYFIFILAFIWLVFASVQDVRKREISNWLNFSLIGFGLAFKFAYSLFNGWGMFIYGVITFLVFYVLALVVYYSGAFGGGDAKLIMGIGAVLPSDTILTAGYSSLVFLFLFMMIGAGYSLIYSGFVAISNKNRFKPVFKMFFRKIWNSYYFILPLVIVIIALNLGYPFIFLGFLILILPILYSYTKAVDSYMIKLVSWKDLQEGDWIVNNIKIGNKIIGKKAYGLNAEEN